VLVPIEHVSGADPDWRVPIQDELQRCDGVCDVLLIRSYLDALQQCATAQGCVMIAFHLVHPRVQHHAHQHVLFVPDTPQLLETLQRDAMAADLIYRDTEPTSQMTGFWSVRLPSGKSCWLHHREQFDAQFLRWVMLTCIRLILCSRSLALALGLAARIDWKACVASVEEETALVSVWKRHFRPYDPVQHHVPTP
jgi:hypothetical protein